MYYIDDLLPHVHVQLHPVELVEITEHIPRVLVLYGC